MEAVDGKTGRGSWLQRTVGQGHHPIVSGLSRNIIFVAVTRNHSEQITQDIRCHRLFLVFHFKQTEEGSLRLLITADVFNFGGQASRMKRVPSFYRTQLPVFIPLLILISFTLFQKARL